MANYEHLAILKKGVKEWNAWRKTNRYIKPDLMEADLMGADLMGANLMDVDLSDANLNNTILSQAHLTSADLHFVNLCNADLSNSCLDFTDCSEANLDGANLSSADLGYSDFSGANLNGANLSGTLMDGTIFRSTLFENTDFKYATVGEAYFSDVNLQNVKNLVTLYHNRPSSVDYRTIQKSWPLPLEFLRGVGFPDNWIEYFPSLVGVPIQFYSCFISYSRKDEEFVDRLYADLQNKGIRCYQDKKDMEWGAHTRRAIDHEIKRRDKVLLVISEYSVESDWVEREVELTLEQEKKRKKIILTPFRIDDAVMQTDEPWASDLRRRRNFGDFCNWKDHDTYQAAFNKLLKHLKTD